ncbi:MAG: hypothetical protein M1837_004694 [Sclerophora amabilis]|nr:MAG: hypothetical protein M1837_004694 [Sclerophora amabilis]
MVLFSTYLSNRHVKSSENPSLDLRTTADDREHPKSAHMVIEMMLRLLLLLLLSCLNVSLAKPTTGSSGLLVRQDRPRWIVTDFPEEVQCPVITGYDVLAHVAAQFVRGLDYEDRPQFKEIYPRYLTTSEKGGIYHPTDDVPRSVFILLVFWNGWDRRYRGPPPAPLVENPVDDELTPEEWIKNEITPKSGWDIHRHQGTRRRCSGSLRSSRYDYIIAYRIGSNKGTRRNQGGRFVRTAIGNVRNAIEAQRRTGARVPDIPLPEEEASRESLEDIEYTVDNHLLDE